MFELPWQLVEIDIVDRLADVTHEIFSLGNHFLLALRLIDLSAYTWQCTGPLFGGFPIHLASFGSHCFL
jgi:hypothetical protein